MTERRHRRPFVGVAQVGLAIALAGCSSLYMPRRSPHVRMVLVGGQVSYVREGRTIDDGILGGGLFDAVAGDREAEALADTYASRKTAGFVLSLTGLACAGIIPLQDPAGLDDLETAFGLTIACAVALSMTGAFIAVSAIPYQYDAVNVFNDHLELRMEAARAASVPMPVPGPPPTPPASTAAPTPGPPIVPATPTAPAPATAAPATTAPAPTTVP